MDRKEIFANAINALVAQKLRSASAVLGIIVGIGTSATGRCELG